MATKIKESHPFSIRMDKAIFERLNEFCEKVGQSKTVAIERAIDKYIDYSSHDHFQHYLFANFLQEIVVTVRFA